MTVSYLKAHGGREERLGRVWYLIWPDGTSMRDVVFSARDAETIASVRHMTLDDARIRHLVMGLPHFAPGQPIPCLMLPGVLVDVHGFWSLWRIALQSEGWNTILRERGFDLITFDDPIAFRYIYEAKYRAHWDNGESGALVVALRASDHA